MIRGNLPQVTKKFTPTWSYLEEFRRQDGEFKQRQKQDYDHRHTVRRLPLIPDETEVWITSCPQLIQGLATPAKAPRSYKVVTESGEVHRNRSHLNVIPDTSTTSNLTQFDLAKRTAMNDYDPFANWNDHTSSKLTMTGREMWHKGHYCSIGWY